MTEKSFNFTLKSLEDFRKNGLFLEDDYLNKIVFEFIKTDYELNKISDYYDQFLLGGNILTILKEMARDILEEDLVKIFQRFKIKKSFFEILTNNLLNVFTFGTYQRVYYDYTENYKIDLMDQEQLEGFNRAVIFYIMIYQNEQENVQNITEIFDKYFGEKHNETFYDFLNTQED